MYTVAAMYRFVALDNPAGLVDDLRCLFPPPRRSASGASADSGRSPHGLLGTLLLAPEGVNGTLAGPAMTIERLLSFLVERTGLDKAEVKFSKTEAQPFRRLKFKHKREIITFRNAPVDPSRPGEYVAPVDWNALLSDPEMLLLDTRNAYESELGTFAGAQTPPLENFSAFVGWVRENLDPERHRKVAMFCTGGIRCEKASAWMLQQGFPEVFHLKGGILKYLEEVPKEHSRWQGNCYVFDERVSVNHGHFAAGPVS